MCSVLFFLSLFKSYFLMFVIKDYETAQPYLLAKNSPPPLCLKLLCTEPAPAQSLSLRLMEPRGVSHKKPVVRSRLTVSELKSVRAVCAGLQHRDNVPLASAPGVTPLSSTQPPKSAHPSFFSLFFLSVYLSLSFAAYLCLFILCIFPL